MFRHVLIAGIGLMGSSIARAVKTHRLAMYVAACDNSAPALHTALSLGIVDGICTLDDCVQEAASTDLLILATPLSAYDEVMKALSPYLSPDAIITDVGSLKMCTLASVCDYLPEVQRPFFVPGHPIAGTERSGPEAGRGDLFEGRNVLLCEAGNTDELAIHRVQTLWEAMGARVEMMDIVWHDRVYGKVSHAVQLMSFCYGLLLQSLDEKLLKEAKEKNDERFRTFLRLTGSDTIMWRDIFCSNARNIIQALEGHMKQLQHIADALEQENLENLLGIVRSAAISRDIYRQRLEDGAVEVETDYTISKGSLPLTVVMDVIPLCIASALMHHLSEEEYAYAMGSGFRGMTQCLLQFADEEVLALEGMCSPILEALQLYGQMVMNLAKAIAQGDMHGTEQQLSRAREAYRMVY